MDWKRLQARYARLEWRQRLGNLASTLARAATTANTPRTAGSVSDLLREGMWIIELSQHDTPLNVLVELASMQHELGLLQQAWKQDNSVTRPLVVFRARAMAERVLELSGMTRGYGRPA